MALAAASRHQRFLARLPVAEPLLRRSVLSDPNQRVNAWVAENRVSSTGADGTVGLRIADLQGLPADAKELDGQLVKVDGKMKLGGNFLHPVFAKERSLVTSDPADQGMLYLALDTAIRKLVSLGFDIPKIIASRHGNKTHQVVAHANAVRDLNAWYSTQSHELTFGTAEEKWHLASDMDVTVHEFGHLTLDHILPGLFGGEGGAIHEAFGDALAMFMHHDGELSEDFRRALDKPDDPAEGLRNGNNTLTIKEAGTEVHDRSRCYTGFWWSLRKGLIHSDGPFKLDPLVADDLMLKVQLTHAFQYKSGRPTTKDFVAAVSDAVRILGEQGQLGHGVDPELFRKAVLDEGAKRKLITLPQYQELLLGNALPQAQNLDDVVAGYGNTVRFVSVHHAEHAVGALELLQQRYVSAQQGDLEVEGSRLFIRRGPNRAILDISDGDARSIAPGEIDETVAVTAQQALVHALRAARARATRALRDLQNQKQQTTDPIDLAPFHMARRIWDTTVEELRQAIQRNESPELVVPKSGATLAWRFCGSMADYRVDATTGTAAARQTVVVM